MIIRKRTRQIYVGNIAIGGDAPIVVQSMTSTKTEDVEKTIEQIIRLEDAGCEVVRIAISSSQALKSIPKILEASSIPVIGDIHFNFRYAIEAIESGINGVRVNPGNFGDLSNLKKVVECAKKHSTSQKQVAIRIGVNAGSVNKTILEKYKGATPEALVESAMQTVEFVDKLDFRNFKVSLKSSNIEDNIRANLLFGETIDVPIHLGVTEAGIKDSSLIKSSIGLGFLILKGVGDTLRVSICGDPVEEVKAAYKIMSFLNVRRVYPEVIACPVCGRVGLDVEEIATKIENLIYQKNIKKNIKIAVMGCVVNGPGEAREADIAVCGSGDEVHLFKDGVVVKKVKREEVFESLETLMSESFGSSS